MHMADALLSPAVAGTMYVASAGVAAYSIKKIREEELNMNKTQLAREIGTSSQFLGFVEEGKGNLVYYSLRKLREISGHSADYILFGLDDNCINKTKKLLKNYQEEEIIDVLNIIENLTLLLKKR